MPRPRVLFAFFVAILLTTLSGSALAGNPAKSMSSASLPAQLSGLVDHIAQIDGPATVVTGPTGRTVATWTYRAQGEFDIAVAVREPGSAEWGAPAFFGRRSGFDEVDPAIAFDASGTAYLAFTMPAPSRVAVSELPSTSTAWSPLVIVSGTSIASSPALMVAGEHLIIGFRTVQGTRLVDIPVTSIANQINGIQDGPDSVDPLGVKGKLPRGQ